MKTASSISPTVPAPGQADADVLDERAAVWARKPLLRAIYHRYYAEMMGWLARGGRPAASGPGREGFGTILELGAGSGTFREYFHAHHAGAARLITSDIIPTRHCDLAVDALHLPLPDATLDNLAMMDVLHHIPQPLAFFAEAQRVLRTGGRMVLVEPYISPFSRAVFKVSHPEPVDTKAVLFAEGGTDPSAFTGTGPFAANQATPTLLFFRDLRRFQQRFPGLRVLARRRMSTLVYPLSGGFSGRQLLPDSAAGVGFGIERLLAPLARLLAFRVLVVVEKVG